MGAQRHHIPLQDRAPRLVAYIHPISDEYGLHADLVVVDEAYPSQPDTLYGERLRGHRLPTAAPTQRAAERQLADAKFQVTGAWRRNPGRDGWFASVRDTQQH